MNQIEAAKFIRETEAANKAARKKAEDYLVSTLKRQPTDSEIKQQVLCDVYKVRLVNGRVSL